MPGYPNLQEQAAIAAAETLMVETMARYDPSHDKYHVQRVRKTALAIARSLPTTPDLLVVELAALLHDVLDKKYVSDKDVADPYAYFMPFFTTIDTSNPGLELIPSGRAKLISDVVQNVSWTTEKKLREQDLWSSWHETCLELHCVQDADRLDAIGAFGIMRCAAYSTVTNRPLHTSTDDAACSNTAIAHFYDKLVRIYSRLKTAPGKLLGKKRHKVLLDFLNSVEEELNPNPTNLS